jgi:hypothetical protein
MYSVCDVVSLLISDTYKSSSYILYKWNSIWLFDDQAAIIAIQTVPYFVSPSMTAISHSKPAPTETFGESYSNGLLTVDILWHRISYFLKAGELFVRIRCTQQTANEIVAEKTFDCIWSLLFRSISVLLCAGTVNDTTVPVLTFPIDGLRQDVDTTC